MLLPPTSITTLILFIQFMPIITSKTSPDITIGLVLDVIMGMNWMNKMGVVIDVGGRSISLKEPVGACVLSSRGS
jgi:hypothetical protein